MKTKIICFRHPKYDGKISPTLECKVCCKIYVDLIRKNNNTELSVISIKKEATDEKTSANK